MRKGGGHDAESVPLAAASLSLRPSGLQAVSRFVDEKLGNTRLNVRLVMLEHSFGELTFRSRSSNTTTLPAPKVSNGVRMCQVRAHHRQLGNACAGGMMSYQRGRGEAPQESKVIGDKRDTAAAGDGFGYQVLG